MKGLSVLSVYLIFTSGNADYIGSTTPRTPDPVENGGESLTEFEILGIELESLNIFYQPAFVF